MKKLSHLYTHMLHSPDFEQVLNIETDNKQAKNEIKKIEGLLREREEERRRAEEPSNIVHAIDKPPYLRSKVSIDLLEVIRC